ncbi:MAG: hypothetical protein IBJ00_05810 [Alphaproteobacteria bacterium]|nr:hypothetical protein [Alphaproteobacteria bacterium]
MAKHNSLKMTTVGFLALASTCVLASENDSTNRSSSTSSFGSPRSSSPSSSPYRFHERQSNPSESIQIQEPRVSKDRLVTYSNVFGETYREQDERAQVMADAIKKNVHAIQDVAYNMQQTRQGVAKKEEYLLLIENCEKTLEARKALIESHLGTENELESSLKKKLEECAIAIEALEKVNTSLITAGILSDLKKAASEVEEKLKLLNNSPRELSDKMLEAKEYVAKTKVWTPLEQLRAKYDKTKKDLDALCELKVQTVIDFPFGNLLNQSHVSRALEMIGFQRDIVQTTVPERLWTAVVQFVTLPILTPQMESAATPLLKSSLASMIKAYRNHLKNLWAIAPAVASLVKEKGLDLTPHVEKEKEKYKVLSANHSQFIGRNGGMDSPSPKTLFLNLIKRNSTLRLDKFEDFLAPLDLSTPLRGFEMLCGALKGSNQLTADYLNKPNAFTRISEMHQENVQSLEELSNEYMIFVYDLLALHFNQSILEVILEDITYSEQAHAANLAQESEFVGL